MKPPTIMPTMPLVCTGTNAGRGTLHSRISAGIAEPSTWLSRPSRTIASAVDEDQELLVTAPLPFVEDRADVNGFHRVLSNQTPEREPIRPIPSLSPELPTSSVLRLSRRHRLLSALVARREDHVRATSAPAADAPRLRPAARRVR